MAHKKPKITNLRSPSTCESLYFLGDIHGNAVGTFAQIERLDIRDALIIQVGDFGVGFQQKEWDLMWLATLSKKLADRNCYLWAIRGNHDDPAWFDGSSVGNTKLLRDYTLIDHKGTNILCVGGAISVDRNARKQSAKKGSPPKWFKKEGFVLDKAVSESVRGVDILVTHTAPLRAFPSIETDGWGIAAKFFHIDPNLRTELIQEREQLEELFETIEKHNTISRHYYGHFHDSKQQLIKNTTHRLLDIDEVQINLYEK